MQLDLSALKQWNDSEKITDSIREFCRKSDIFAWISDETFNEVMQKSYIASYKALDIIIKEWTESNGRVYFILEWDAIVSIEWKQIAEINSWNIFWEYAIMCEEKRSATITARTDIKCLVLDKNSLLLLANEDFKINNILATRVENNCDAEVGGVFK